MTIPTTSKTSFLVALHGLPRVGKDTLATALKHHMGFKRVSFADALYDEVAESFGVRVDELQSQAWKTEPQNLLSVHCSDCAKFRALMQVTGADLFTPRTSRYILRAWAHDYRRSQNQGYWISEFFQTTSAVVGNIVVTDLRYLDDEYPFLQSFAEDTNRRFAVIEVVNPSVVPPPHHVSDDRLPSGLIHKTVVNQLGDPAQMVNDVLQFLWKEEKA